MGDDAFKNRFAAAAVGGLIALLMLYPDDAMDAVRAACGLWARSVMPALFPYMVASSLLVSVTGRKALTVPLSFLGGSPAGARLVSLAASSAEQAQTLAALCTTVSPLYILGALSGGPRMLLPHWLGACVAFGCVRLMPIFARFRTIPAGVFFARQGGKKSAGMVRNIAGIGTTPRAAEARENAPQSRMSRRPAFADIVRDATLASLAICGYMALFMALSALLARVLPLTRALRALLLCTLEMAGGCAALLSLGLPASRATPLLCAAVSFGGLSIFMQNALFLKPAGVNMRVQLIARAVHAAAAYGLCALSFRVW